MTRFGSHLRPLLVGGVLLLGACRAATLAYGPDAATAHANADALLSALEQRFTAVVRQPKFLHARMRIARYALAPSKLVNDTALWTGMQSVRTGADRSLELSGALSNGQYVFTPRERAPQPSRTGESRHLIGLVQLGKQGDWQWTTAVDNAIGPMPPARAADVMRALFLSAERPSAAVRADYRSAFPRASVAFGRLFALDSLNTVTQSDGSTLVSMQVLTTDTNLRGGFPELAKFIRKYVPNGRFHFRLIDRAGGEYFSAQHTKSRLIMRFRTHNGELQPIVGAARRMPDSLQLHVDGSAKFGMFTVGMSEMIGDFVHVGTSTERAWSMRFTREPKWDLPLLAEQLLNSPLKRPFEGNGVQFRIGFRSTTESQTILSRTLIFAARESAIMRFFGNLGFTAMSDFAGKVEEEENRFLAEGFSALRQDIAAQR